MNKYFLGMAIASLFCSQSALSDGLADTFSNGRVSGDLNLYYKHLDEQGGADPAYATGFLGLKYETAQLNGLQLGLALRHGSEIYEKNSGDSDEGVGTLLTEAYLRYQGDTFGAIVGRQEIDLEWVADYHEAITLTSAALPNTELTVGYSRSIAVADEDDLQESFTDIGDDGAYFLDAKINTIESVTLNPYYLKADGIFNAIGIKAELEHASGLGATAHYATSDVEVTGEQDGDILHLELRGGVGELALSGGYIVTDEQGGSGHLDELGDNINPLEEGNQVYAEDARTWYLGAEYALGNATFGLMYGDTDYASGAQEQELNLVLDYDLNAVAENLSFNLVYANIDAENSSDDYDKLSMMLSYAF